MPEIDALVAMTEALGAAGGLVTVLWLLIREQARYEALVKWVLEQYPKKNNSDE